MSRLVSIYHFKTKYLEYYKNKRHQFLRTSKQSSSFNMLNFLVNYSSFLYCSCYEQPKNVIRRRKLKSRYLYCLMWFSFILSRCFYFIVFSYRTLFSCLILFFCFLDSLTNLSWLSHIDFSLLTSDQGSYLYVDPDSVEDSLMSDFFSSWIVSSWVIFILLLSSS